GIPRPTWPMKVSSLTHAPSSCRLLMDGGTTSTVEATVVGATRSSSRSRFGFMVTLSFHEAPGAHTEHRRTSKRSCWAWRDRREPFVPSPQLGTRQGNPRRREARPTNASDVHPFSTCHVLNLPRNRL